uniref:RRM domain-containing protein n=1 Tax=Anolis carolinensis TaxID=28377 RepID=A0A803TJM5_ANOCA
RRENYGGLQSERNPLVVVCFQWRALLSGLEAFPPAEAWRTPHSRHGPHVGAFLQHGRPHGPAAGPFPHHIPAVSAPSQALPAAEAFAQGRPADGAVFSRARPSRAGLSYASYDEPRYSRLLVVPEGKYRFLRRHFASFGDIEEVWGPISGSGTAKKNPRGPVFVKYARSSQALLALEASVQVPGISQVYLAQSRVPGKSNELVVDVQKLTEIHITVLPSFNKNHLVKTFQVYGAIVSCSFIKNKVEESKHLAIIKFSKASEAALAIEECDKRFQAVWAEPKPDPPKHPELRFGVYGTQQGTTKHEVQGATLNTICKNTSLAKVVTEPSKVSESKSPVNNTKQKTTCKEVQESSVNTLGKSTRITEPSKLSESNSPIANPKHKTTSNEVEVSSSNTLDKDTKRVKPAMKPVASSESKFPVNNPKHKTTNNEVEVSSSNTLDKHTKWNQKPTAPSVICTEKKTVTSEMQWSNLIPVVSRTTLNVPVNRTESKPGGTGQNTITHRISSSNLIILGSEPGSSVDSSTRSKIEQKRSRTCRSNLITLASVDNTTSSEPAARAPESSVNYRVNHTEEKINFTSAEENNLIALGYSANEVQQVFKPPEHYGYEYYVGGTDYSAALSEPSMHPPGTNLHSYYYTSGVEQQADDHSVKESNLMSSGYSTYLPVSVTQPLEPSVCPIYESTAEPEVKSAEIQHDTVFTTDKSLKSSEWKFYMGGARRKKKNQGNSLLTSVDPPDLASVERGNTRKQESISRHLLMFSEFPLTEEQIFGLFDVIPGLESCETRPGLRSKRGNEKY